VKRDRADDSAHCGCESRSSSDYPIKLKRRFKPEAAFLRLQRQLAVTAAPGSLGLVSDPALTHRTFQDLRKCRSLSIFIKQGVAY
jgi:hypothetical protein